MKEHACPVADLPTLAERYGMSPFEVEDGFQSAVERREMREPWEFQGVRLWAVGEADVWFCRHLLDEYGVTQHDLSDALNVSPSGLSRWLRQHGLPRYIVPKLRRIIEEIAATREAAA